MREALDEVHNDLTLVKVPGASSKERLAFANHVLHNLVGIEENSKETLEYLKQKLQENFKYLMSTGDKTFRELCTKRNTIAKSLWQTKTKMCVAQTFPMDVK